MIPHDTKFIASVNKPLYEHKATSFPFIERTTHEFWKVLEGVEHVEPVVVDGSRCHRVVAQIESLSQLHDESVQVGQQTFLLYVATLLMLPIVIYNSCTIQKCKHPAKIMY
jgi:hypothetical protein